MNNVVELRDYQDEETAIRLDWGVWREPPVIVDFRECEGQRLLDTHSETVRLWELRKEEELIQIKQRLAELDDQLSNQKTMRDKWSLMDAIAERIMEIFE